MTYKSNPISYPSYSFPRLQWHQKVHFTTGRNLHVPVATSVGLVPRIIFCFRAEESLVYQATPSLTLQKMVWLYRLRRAWL